MKFSQEHLGHAKPETTMRYIHASEEDLLRGSEILVQKMSVKKEIVKWNR